jgi:hypothetical protein
VRWDGPVFSGLRKKKVISSRAKLGRPGAGRLESTGGFAVDSFPMVPGLGQAVETVWRWYTRARGMRGALSRQPRAERPHIIPISSIHHQYIPLGRRVQTYISVHPHHVFRSISPSHRPNPPGTSQGAWIQPHASPLARLSSPPHPRPDEAAMPPGTPPTPPRQLVNPPAA